MRTLRMAGSGFVAVELSDTQASMASMLLPFGSCTNERGVIGRSVVRQPMHGELTETIVAGAA